jgi:hypothetical protein
MTPSFVGAADKVTGTYSQDNALFLKVFAGEVLNAFDETNVMMDKHMVRSIESGNVAQFPNSWKVNAAYHVPGAQRLGAQTMGHNERLIFLDDFLSSDIFLAKIDELKNHYDVRSEYAKQLGEALARTADKQLLQVGILTARTAANITGADAGAALTRALALTDGEVLAASVFDCAQTWDEKNVPENDRYFFVKPAQYYLLAQTTNVLNRDWGGQGSYAEGKVLKVADVAIIKTNNLPQSVIAAVSGENNTYDGTFTTVAALGMQKGAIGTVKRVDLSMHMTAPDGDFFTMYNGTLLVAQYLMGHGVLRPESAIEIKTA